MSLTTLRFSKADAIATIVLARPDKLNALNAAMHAELRACLEECERDEAVKVVVLTGEGRAFSSGQDLTEDLPRDAQGRIDLGPPLARDYNPLIRRLATYPKVTIAALNGPAVGASMNIALACDIVVAARSAYLQEAFAKIALVPDAGGTWILPRLVGPKQALALMLTAEAVPADEALRMGLVYKVFDDATFTADVGDFGAPPLRGARACLPADETSVGRQPWERPRDPARARSGPPEPGRFQPRLRGGRRGVPREALSALRRPLSEARHETSLSDPRTRHPRRRHRPRGFKRPGAVQQLSEMYDAAAFTDDTRDTVILLIAIGLGGFIGYLTLTRR